MWKAGGWQRKPSYFLNIYFTIFLSKQFCLKSILFHKIFGKVFIQKWNASLTIFRQELQSPIDQQKICYLEVSERKIELASLAYPSVVSGGRIHYINFNHVNPDPWLRFPGLSQALCLIQILIMTLCGARFPRFSNNCVRNILQICVDLS